MLQANIITGRMALQRHASSHGPSHVPAAICWCICRRNMDPLSAVSIRTGSVGYLFLVSVSGEQKKKTNESENNPFSELRFSLWNFIGWWKSGKKRLGDGVGWPQRGCCLAFRSQNLLLLNGILSQHQHSLFIYLLITHLFTHYFLRVEPIDLHGLCKSSVLIRWLFSVSVLPQTIKHFQQGLPSISHVQMACFSSCHRERRDWEERSFQSSLLGCG